MLRYLDPDYPDWQDVHDLAGYLRDGQILALPTDTCYTLCCSVMDAKAVKRLAEVKKVDRSKRFSLICADIDQATRFVDSMSSAAYRAVKTLLPGPYTLVVPAGPEIPKLLATKQRSFGMRVPDHLMLQSLLGDLGHPIACTSLPWDIENEPIQYPEAIDEAWGERVDLVVGQGPLMAEQSTVLDFSVHPPELIREGKGDISLFE